jgi:hypothetical protein
MIEGMKTESRVKAVRRIARRRGYRVSLSRARDPLAVSYGRWTVTGREGEQVSPDGGWTLEEVEAWQKRQRDEALRALQPVLAAVDKRKRSRQGGESDRDR